MYFTIRFLLNKAVFSDKDEMSFGYLQDYQVSNDCGANMVLTD